MAGEQDSVVNITHWRQDARQKVLEQLFIEHEAALRQFLRVRFNSDVDLDDIIQDVFVWLAKQDNLFQRVSPRSGSNRSLLLSAANSMAVDRERRKKVRRKYKEAYQEEAQPQVVDITPEKIVEQREQLARVHKIIMGLRPGWRKVFVMNRFEHKSYREIADDMNVSVKQIEKYMSCALREIRKAIQQTPNVSETCGKGL